MNWLVACHSYKTESYDRILNNANFLLLLLQKKNNNIYSNFIYTTNSDSYTSPYMDKGNFYF